MPDKYEIGFDIKVIDKLISSETTITWPEAFAVFTKMCSKYSTHFEFAYGAGENGKYTMIVNGQAFANDDDTAAKYERETYAIYDGFRILREVLVGILEEEDDET